MVIAEGSIKPIIQKQKPRKVHLFGKADWGKLKSLMKGYQERFLLDYAGKSVDYLWTSFTDTLNKYMNECIPTKLIRGKSSLPWITQDIKRLIRKRDRLYCSYKKSRNPAKKESFQTLRQQIKRKIKDAYHIHLEGLLGLNDDDRCDSKKLFSF